MNDEIVECDRCGFGYEARCVADGKTATEDCPACNETNLESQLAALRDELARVRQEGRTTTNTM